ncbi:MAG: regulatory protein GemA [Deltaproteobacteria bacterium]|nr:regulatory protein GemA [Deltaproteobacteria bacterium]
MADGSYRRKALAKIHIAKKELGLSDDEYRDVIRSVVPGKDSAADLSDPQLHDLLNRLHEIGWRPRLRRGASRPLPPTVWKARSLWLELHDMGAVRNPGWTSMARFCKRMTGTQDLRMLDNHQAMVVIEALKDWLHREQEKKRA